MRTYFRKFYTRINEKDYGAVQWSVVVFDKRAYSFNARVLEEDEALQKGYLVENVVTQYRCFLRIDLWLVVFDFDWTSSPRSSNADNLALNKN